MVIDNQKIILSRMMLIEKQTDILLSAIVIVKHRKMSLVSRHWLSVAKIIFRSFTTIIRTENA